MTDPINQNPNTDPVFRLSHLPSKTPGGLDAEKLLEWLQVAEQAINANETKITQLIAEKENLLNSLTELQRQEGKDNSKLFQLVAELEKKETESQELITVNNLLQGELTGFQRQVQEKQKEVRHLSKLAEEKDQHLLGLEKNLIQKEEEINNLHRRLNSLSDKQRKSRKSWERLEQSLASALEEQEKKELQIQKYQARVQYWQEKSRSIEAIQVELLKEIEQRRRSSTILQREINGLKSTNARLASELEQFQRTWEDSKRDIEKKEQEVAELQVKINNLSQETKRAGRRLSQNQEYQQLKQQLANYEDTIADYQKSLSEMNNNLEDQEQKQQSFLERMKKELPFETYQQLEQSYQNIFLNYEEEEEETEIPKSPPLSPPWYKSWWVWVIGVLVLVGIGVVWHYWRRISSIF